ncbi:hypothetical protein PRUPE_7G128700 [Prunus persica]|uniref:AMP-activated protein kinase glycogen-binding domain-containing protein n=1 Tax=Prunus persica TaxID=3760 RepID=A0A251NAR6_PRUPE|nr:uncharacterized protein LOC18771723 isoform X1 [Prunus persica]ONH96433.1 hypothetical protein PRUPE_7G128700 [Prunus persica]
MAANVSHLPAFLSLFSQNLVFSDPKQQPKQLRWAAQQQRLPPPHFTVRASSVKKKTSRKVKSNEELRNELREFLTAVGLPKDHVPSLKDFSQHGRNDLANIVRRRGYKLIRKLLADSTKTDINGNVDNGVAGIQDATNDPKVIITGQDQEVNDAVEDFSLLSEVSTLEISSGGLITDPDPNHNDSGHAPVESSVDSDNLEGHSEQVNNVDGYVYVSTSVPVMENHSNMPLEISSDSSLPATVPVKENDSFGSDVGWNLNSGGHPSMPVESVPGLSSDGKVRGQDAKLDNMAEEYSSLTEVSVAEDHSSCSNIEPTHNSDHHSDAPLESPSNSSLDEKVAKFMQNGDLDTVEDKIYGILIGNEAENINEESKFGNTEDVQIRIRASEHSKSALDGSDATLTSASKQLLPSTTVDASLSRDDSSSAEGISSLSGKDSDVKTSEREDQLDINNLKFMLHQKEMELCRLKEQIEKEKLALSKLQTNAETAISKAQKLVFEKDAELLAAEESLSGLVEVEIQYRGDGEIVEVTGSFNGWHHQIEMDPQPSSSIIGPTGSRKTRLWSTRLWLYPGIYEIKFIVDGQWKIDPQRESVTRGTICNNILQVDR